jgi:3-isopropylmalate dehydratase large subunit
MTIIEKIFSRSAGVDVKAGDYVWAHMSLVTMRDFGGPNVTQEYEAAFGHAPVFDRHKVAITFDLHIPARNEKVATNQKILRDFAHAQGVRLFDIETGIGQHIVLEHGLVRPGDVIVGTDSHMNLLGAVCAAGFGMGTTDIAGALYKGRLWFHVPPTCNIRIEGRLPERTTAKDVILMVLKSLKTDGALNRAIEFTGPTVDAMNLAERITMASMVTEMSGDVGLFVPNKPTIDFLKAHTHGTFETFSPDPDVQYEQTFTFTVDALKPQIACPHSPDNVVDVETVAGTKVDQVFIGSCTNGRFEDLKLAAEVLKGHHVHSGVRLIIVPATQGVARQALEAGLYEQFFSSGAVVTNPGCALCTTGHPGILAPNEVMVSTSNRNFVGKLGKGAHVFLASPATAAATALTGVITDPRSL